METKTTSTAKLQIQARIIRADGRVENLGTISGGSFRQKVASYVRIKFANLRQWLKY